MQNEEQIYNQPLNDNKENLDMALNENSYKVVENYNKPKSSKFKIVLFTLIGVFVLSGVAYGSWYGYKKYFATPDLAKLILDSIENSKKVDKFKIEYEFDFELGKINKLKIPGQLGLGSLSDVLGTDDNKFNLKGSNFTDKSDLKNIKTENNILFNGSVSLGKIGINSKFINNIIYFKLTEVPLLTSMFIDSNTIKDIWIKLDTDKRGDLINEYKDFFKKDEYSEFKEEKINVKDVFDEIKKCSDEVMDNKELINCRFKFKPEGSKIYLTRVRETMGKNKKFKKEISKLANKNWDKIYKILNKTTFDLTFTKKGHYLSKLIIFYKDEENSTSVKNAILKIVIDNFVKEAKITAPTNAIDLEKLIKKVMTNGNATMGLQAPASLENKTMDSLDDARARARDSKRISDIKQIMTGLELYYNDNNHYPIATNKVLLGVGNYACLGLDDFTSSNCDRFIMKKIPTNPGPETREYAYQCLDGKNYRLEFGLEIGSGSYSSGAYIADTKGINIGNDALFIKEDNKNLDNTTNKDSDGDGLNDYDELNIYHTNIHNIDTDGDGYNDGDEVKAGYNPNGKGKL